MAPDRRTPIKVLVNKTYSFVHGAIWDSYVSRNRVNLVIMYRRIFQFNRPVDDYEEMVGDDLDLLEDGRLVPHSESDDSDDEQDR